jgi:hypothetical protein
MHPRVGWPNKSLFIGYDVYDPAKYQEKKAKGTKKKSSASRTEMDNVHSKKLITDAFVFDRVNNDHENPREQKDGESRSVGSM